MNRQRGVSLFGLLIVSLFLILGAILVTKVLPAITEYFTVVKHLKAIASGGDTSSVAAVRKSYETRKVIDDTPSVAGTDLEVSKEGGDVVISVSYTKRIPLFANVSLLIDFDASSGGGRKPMRAQGI